MSLPAKRYRRWMLRAAGSALMLGILAWIVPVGAVVDGFSRVPPLLFVGVLGGFLLGHLAAAQKWRLLTGGGLGHGAAFQAHFAGLASNLMLPGVAGGDAVRATIAQLSLRDGGRVVAGALADRLIDMLALAILVGIGVAMLQTGDVAVKNRSALLALQVVALFAAILAGALWILPAVLPAIWRKFPRLPAGGLVGRVSVALGDLSRRPFLFIFALGLSVAIQGFFVWLAAQLAQAVGVELPLGAWYFAWPLAKLMAVLPISLGGLGLREASLATLLTPFGAEAAQVVAAGLTWQAVLFLTGGLGAVFLSLSGIGWRPKSPAPEIPNQGP